MKKYSILIIVLAVLGLSACEKDDPEIINTATYPVSGEWWVTYQIRNEAGQLEDVGGGYYPLITSNTASNKPDSIWITDEGTYWDYQVKAGLDLPNKSFAVQEGQNVSYDSKVRIANGKVFLNEGRSTSGVVTDSLYMEVAFDDDSEPFGTTYIVSGHRRTGFLEDEH
ncbi:hypothetical protein GXP67_04530 [Rhodocytophaga rosea]|uniref:Uncharacterized protein n=1 Tax=Rhodocytophaga rosea TaxID=2704465 RepID=A0A6C0GDC8_9BACT|nr:lipid-binding protein [Rhodocytophaga rosea]QHT65986.1 hypothetical protein GXP67_04530 [Rhodocytophaga rosea]